MLQVSDDVVKLVSKYYSRLDLDEDVEILRKWMEKQPHFSTTTTLASHQIRNFLMLSKCSIQAAKEKIDMYYTVRSRLDDIYRAINPKLSYMHETLRIAYILILPQLTTELYRVSMFKVRDKALIDQLDPINIIRIWTNILELRLKEDIFFGEIIVIDANDVTLTLVLKCLPLAMIKKLLVIYEKVFTVRLKALYVVNAPSFADRLLAAAKTVMKPKVFARIKFVSELKEILPLYILPSDYGGPGESLAEIQEKLQLQFQKNSDYFDNLDKIKMVESLRPAKLQNDEVFGYYGNFRQLNID